MSASLNLGNMSVNEMQGELKTGYHISCLRAVLGRCASPVLRKKTRLTHSEELKTSRAGLVRQMVL